MLGDETRAGERHETIDEISALLMVLQGMGRRLSYETHGVAYDKVRDFNVMLHEARLRLDLIEKD